MGAEGSAERPELGRRRRTFRPERWGPSRYALQLLSLVLLSAPVILLVFLLGEILGLARAGSLAVMSGLVVLGLSAVKVLRYRRPAREMHLYERGLVAVTADGSEVVCPWSSTTLFMDGWNRYKLAGPEGVVITIGAAHRPPLLSGDKIRGMRTRTVIRGAQFPEEREWGPAIRHGIQESQVQSTVTAIRSGDEVAFGDVVVNQDGLAVRRRYGQDEFTSWEDVTSLALTDENDLLITSRGIDFPSHYMKPLYQLPNAEVFLDVARGLHERTAQAAPASPTGNGEDLSDTSALVGLHVTFGLAAWAAWRLGTRNEVEGVGDFLLAALGTVMGAVLGAVLGLGLAAASAGAVESLLKTLIRWTRHRRFAAAAALVLGVANLLVLGLFLLREFPSRLLPLVTLLFFGGWALLLAVKRCSESERWYVRHLPDLPGTALFALAAQQLVTGDVLTTVPAAGLFFPPAIWLSWRGWRKMKDSLRPTVRAAADIALSVQLGLVFALLVVWLANVLSLSPAHVAATRKVLEQVQGLTEVHWLYWLAAYTVLALGSYAVLRRPDRVARIRQRLTPTRLGRARLPLGSFVTFGSRSLTGINIACMIALLCAVVLAPVSEGTWKKPVAHRYALEVQRQQHAEGASDAYEEIHRHVTAHPRLAARLRAVVVAVNRAAPSQSGRPVNPTALEIARQVGRFQSATLDLDDPGPPQPTEEPEAEDLSGQVQQLDETQQRTAERETQLHRFSELAAAAVTRTFDIPDLGDNGAVQIIKEYFGGLVEDGLLKKVFLRWGERAGQEPPDGRRLVRIDVSSLISVAYDRTQEAVERANADLLGFYARFGMGVPTEEPSMNRVVDLANQHRHLRQGTGPCPGCVNSEDSGTTPGGGGRR